MKKGNKYGTHRVISPKGVLPQPAILALSPPACSSI